MMAVAPLIEAFLSQLLSSPIDRKMVWGLLSGIDLGSVVVSVALNIYTKMMEEKSICDIISV